MDVISTQIYFVFVNKLRLRGNLTSFYSYLMACYTEGGAQ